MSQNPLSKPSESPSGCNFIFASQILIFILTCNILSYGIILKNILHLLSHKLDHVVSFHFVHVAQCRFKMEVTKGLTYVEMFSAALELIHLHAEDF